MLVARSELNLHAPINALNFFVMHAQDKFPFLSQKFKINWHELAANSLAKDIREGISRAQKDIDKICALPSEEKSYQSVFQRLDDTLFKNLNLPWNLANHLDSVQNSTELRDAINEVLPEVVTFLSGLPLNNELWQSVKIAAINFDHSEKTAGASLTKVQQRHIDENLSQYKAAGADLPADKKEQLMHLNVELARLEQKFGENVLDCENAWELYVYDKKQLAGIPTDTLSMAKKRAEEKGKSKKQKNAWCLSLQAPILIPCMRFAESEELRKKLWLAAKNIAAEAEYDNLPNIQKILSLRDQIAKLLGKKSFANHATERRMVKNGANVIAFIEELWQKSNKKFKEECAELQAFKNEFDKEDADKLHPWEIAYLVEKLKKRDCDFDEEKLRPYFELTNVMRGLFQLSEVLFDIRFKELPTVCTENGKSSAMPVWREDVQYYEVYDKKNNELLGAFYADWHPNEGKRSGAWMNYFFTGLPSQNNKKRQAHLGLICGNLARALPQKPALLTHQEVLTVFHEFGHLLHHILGEVPVRSLNGIAVYWDFVEVPSQFMENFCWQRESLNIFAKHFENGENIPEDTFIALQKTEKFRPASDMMRQLAFASTDIELHQNYQKHKTGVDDELDHLLEQLQKKFTQKTNPPAGNRARQFTHVFSGGYAAGYYSYKWSEALEAQIFAKFKSSGVINSKLGRELRDKILARGNSTDPNELFRDFVGEEASVDALLERCGIA